MTEQSGDPPETLAGTLPETLTARQADIVRIVGEQGYATLEALSQRFDVSVQSIRRDVITLDRLRLLQRFHGGAGASESRVRLGYGEKGRRAADAKLRIGKAAASLVPDGATLFLDVGTTVEVLAQNLTGRQSGLRVFTNSLAVGMILAGDGDVELHIIGGTARGADGSLVGASTVARILSLRFDMAFIGYSGFDEDGTVMDYDLDKIAVKQAAIQRSRTATLLGDSSKYARRATAHIAPVSAFAALVTDEPPPADLGRCFLAQGGLALVEA